MVPYPIGWRSEKWKNDIDRLKILGLGVRGLAIMMRSCYSKG